MPKEVHQHREQLEGRSILVKRADVIPLEAIVRGYITGKFRFNDPYSHPVTRLITSGSAWAEYKKSRTVHGIPQPEGLLESQKLPAPLFTPSTKAEQGAHDENISPERGSKTIAVVTILCGLTSALQPPRSSGKSYTTKSLLLPCDSILPPQSTRPREGSL